MKTVKGLHLWNVELNGTGCSLWITTRRAGGSAGGLILATRKAKQVLKREYDRSITIRGIQSHGTIDA